MADPIPTPASAHEGATAVIRPARNLRGFLRLPGDKSISHRYGMLAGLAAGKSKLYNYSTGADCASTLGVMQALGAKVTRTEDGGIEVEGVGGQLQAPAGPLDCGNSGSTMRMMAGILAGQPFASELFGDASLSGRPMARVMKPLAEMGAKITAAEGNKPPLKLAGVAPGEKLRAIAYTTPVASAQVKSCVLFAGLFAAGETTVMEATPTRDHSEVALRAFGVELQRDAKIGSNKVSLRGGQRLRAIEAAVPGDISTAAFFLCAAAIFPESQLSIAGLLMNPTRAKLFDHLMALGLRVRVTQLEESHGELVGTVQVEGGSLRGGLIAGADAAALIDEIPVLAAIAPYTREGIEFRDAKELRVKESDRIKSIVANLRAMGAEVEEREDGLHVPGGQSLRGAVLDSFDDHRIAMAFSVAALRAEGETTMHRADAARISFPEFFTTLEELLER